MVIQKLAVQLYISSILVNADRISGGVGKNASFAVDVLISVADTGLQVEPGDIPAEVIHAFCMEHFAFVEHLSPTIIDGCTDDLVKIFIEFC